MSEDPQKTTSPYDFGKTNADLQGVFKDMNSGISGNFKDAGKEVSNIFKGAGDQVKGIFQHKKKEEEVTPEKEAEWKINAESTKDPTESLSEKVSELQDKLMRLVDAHDSDTRNTEQDMKLRRLIEQVEILEAKSRTGYPDYDTDPNPAPFIWLGEDDTTNVIERAVNGGTFAPMTQGRTVASTDIYTLDTGQAFYYEFMDFNGGTQVMRRVKVSGGGGTTQIELAVIDSNRTAYGRYKMFISSPSTVALVVDSTATLADADISDGATAEEVTGYNPHEVGMLTHALTAGTPICTQFNVIRESRVDENGKQIVRIIDGFNVRLC